MRSNTPHVIILTLMLILIGCSPTKRSTSEGQSRSINDYEPAVSHLAKGTDEAVGYGLYTYVLMTKIGSRQDEELLKAVLSECYYQFSTVGETETYFEKDEINLIYIPTDTQFEVNENVDGDKDLANWLADQVVPKYDKIRARKLIRKVKRGQDDGLYLVTTYDPIRSDSKDFEGDFLIQDLSGINPRIAQLWVAKYIEIASNPSNWESGNMGTFGIRVRDTMASIADELSGVIESHEKWAAILNNKIFWNS